MGSCDWAAIWAWYHHDVLWCFIACTLEQVPRLIVVSSKPRTRNHSTVTNQIETELPNSTMFAQLYTSLVKPPENHYPKQSWLSHKKLHFPKRKQHGKTYYEACLYLKKQSQNYMKPMASTYRQQQVQVGGKDGGIVVREGHSLNSSECFGRNYSSALLGESF